MEAAHRDILRKNYSGLVQAIQPVQEVVDKLLQFKVLTCLMKAEIIEKPQTSFDRELETDKTELQDPRCHIDLGNDVFVTAKMWNDELNIHVRKYDVYPSGRSYPTKRGIVLSLKHWLELSGVHFKLQEAIDQGRTHDYAHVGANMYATLDPNGGVDLRQWEKYEHLGRVVPTAKGILLSKQQWQKPRDCCDVMTDFVPELKEMVPCMGQEDHQNQIGYLMCSFCNPNSDHKAVNNVPRVQSDFFQKGRHA
ncbi:uncharacterized protein LOC124265992 [Haliotis rubra]|uniref:uncharacterized protein LOC124265992 n=1 Tax=Haliotis rubra TaxID=36100 RepID=UPI001EE5EA8D|nr:uncharacterized protein LOC124265992 [Haliotis rubra]